MSNSTLEFNYNAANVLCRSLGYNQMVQDIIRINSQTINEENMNDYPISEDEYIWITEFKCNNTLATELNTFDLLLNKIQTKFNQELSHLILMQVIMDMSILVVSK